MNDESYTPKPPPATPTPEPHDRREQRHAERDARWQGRAERLEHHSRRSSLIWGVILVLLGIVLFLQNAGVPIGLNWWAIFILIPAFWSLSGGWETYRAQGRLTRRAAGSLVGGTLLAIVALIFLLGLEFGTMWPLLLVVGGAALILTGFVPE